MHNSSKFTLFSVSSSSRSRLDSDKIYVARASDDCCEYMSVTLSGEIPFKGVFLMCFEVDSA